MTNILSAQAVVGAFQKAGADEAAGELARPNAITTAVAAAMQGVAVFSRDEKSPKHALCEDDAERLFNLYIRRKAKRFGDDESVEGLVKESTRKKSVSEFRLFIKGACAGVTLASFPYDELLRIAQDAVKRAGGHRWNDLCTIMRKINERKIEAEYGPEDSREEREYAVREAMIRALSKDDPADDKPVKVKDEEKLYAELIKLAEGIRDGKSPSDKSPGREPFPSEAINQIIAIAKTRAAGLAAAASTGTRAENYHSMVAFASRRAA